MAALLLPTQASALCGPSTSRLSPRRGTRAGGCRAAASGARAEVTTTSSATVAAPAKRAITVEEQRVKAKELVKYFQRLSEERLMAESQIFGWTLKNEISNGRWVMFGLFVGMLTEYATGVDFVDQIKIMVSNLGIADVYNN